MSELFKRILVAAVGIPLAIIIIYAGSWYFTSVTIIISLLALREFYKISEKKHAFPIKIIGYLSAIVIISLFQVFNIFTAIIFFTFAIMIIALVTLILQMWIKKPNATLNISTTLAGILYIPLSFAFLVLIRNLYDIINYIQSSNFIFISINRNILASSDEGAWLLLSVFISIWVCDSAAYFFGKAFGKYKLFERISPKKTWTGAIAGLIFAIVSFWGATEILLRDFPFFHSIAIGVIVGIIGQIGDLSESQIKRDAKIKDSSDLLPGHGGILDRFDSILFVVPVVFIYLFLSISDFF